MRNEDENPKYSKKRDRSSKPSRSGNRHERSNETRRDFHRAKSLGRDRSTSTRFGRHFSRRSSKRSRWLSERIYLRLSPASQVLPQVEPPCFLRDLPARFLLFSLTSLHRHFLPTRLLFHGPVADYFRERPCPRESQTSSPRATLSERARRGGVVGFSDGRGASAPSPLGRLDTGSGIPDWTHPAGLSRQNSRPLNPRSAPPRKRLSLIGLVSRTLARKRRISFGLFRDGFWGEGAGTSVADWKPRRGNNRKPGRKTAEMAGIDKRGTFPPSAEASLLKIQESRLLLRCCARNFDVQTRLVPPPRLMYQRRFPSRNFHSTSDLRILFDAYSDILILWQASLDSL